MENSDVRNDQDQIQVSDQEKQDVVKYETHKKLLGQRKKDQEKIDTLISELSNYKNAEKQRQESELEEQGKFQKLVELRDHKINELQEQLNQTVEAKRSSDDKIEQTWKLQSFYSKLPGKIKKNEYLAHVALDDIVFDTDTMQCDEQSVEAVVNKFMESHGDLVIPTNTKKLPSTASNTKVNTEDTGKKPNELLTQGFEKLFG